MPRFVVKDCWQEPHLPYRDVHVVEAALYSHEVDDDGDAVYTFMDGQGRPVQRFYNPEYVRQVSAGGPA